MHSINQTYTYQFFIDNPDVFRSIKMGQALDMKCVHCGDVYVKDKRFLYSAIVRWKSKNNFCTKECEAGFRNAKGSVTENCKRCGVAVSRQNRQRQRTKFVFCSKSCSATYNNTNKKYGIRRSKLEAHIEEQLRSWYPELEIVCNGKSAISSELDMYFPQLQFAIEFNGPTHYHPIYGEEKLEQIQNNDKRKISDCKSAGIELVTLDVSALQYLNKSTKEKYASLIKEKVATKMSAKAL